MFPVIAAVSVLLLAASAGGARGVEEKKKDQPLHLGLVEETGVDLTLVDVEVTDKNGRPIRGLKKDDFAITLDWKAWPVYSVDDLCEREELPSTVVDEGLPGALIGSRPALADRRPENPARFVLYFDFSELQSDGRARAIAQAKRWIRESLRAGDEASIVTYATDAGLKERSQFTSDRRKLAAAIDAAEADTKQTEAWPAFLPHRMCECGTSSGACKPDPTQCPSYAVNEYFHTRRALEAFRAFLDALGDIPGRKAVLYFNEDGVLQPGSLYGQDEHQGGDNTVLLDDLSSVAIASRATVYPVFAGDHLEPSVLPGAAVNFGANLANATGGRYNRGLLDLESLMDKAARAGACVYRIGLRPPDGAARGAHQVRVEAGRTKVPWIYRVRFENPLDRWLDRARAVLRNPAGAVDLPLAAALVPLRTTGGRWKLSVQVALDADAFAFLPAVEGRSAQWQVGALLHREGNNESWEMLGVSNVTRKGAAGPGTAVVHRRDIDELRPGTYRLAAFVRDDNTSLFGGAEAVIELPQAGSGRIAGPVIMRSPRKFSMAALPALAGKDIKGTSVSQLREDALPQRAAPVATGESLEIETWLCPGAARNDAPLPVRFVSKNGTPVFRFEPGEPRDAGGCLMFADVIDAAGLGAGVYSYHFRWNVPGKAEPQEATATFEIAAPDPHL